MKFQRSTLMLVGVAFLLGAGVLIAESQRSPSALSTRSNQASEPILAFAETDVTRLIVDRGNETLIFERDDAGNWQMVEPEAAPAEPGAVAFLLSRLNTDPPQQTVTMTADQATDFGFNAPVGIVTITLQDGTEHELILGGPDFSGTAHYAVIDPDPWPAAAGTEYSVLVVSRDVANGINRPRPEWLMPADTLDPESEAEPTPPTDDGAALENPVDLEAAPASPAEPPTPETDAETDPEPTN
jgi:hypothetical protein